MGAARSRRTADALSDAGMAGALLSRTGAAPEGEASHHPGAGPGQRRAADAAAAVRAPDLWRQCRAIRRSRRQRLQCADPRPKFRSDSGAMAPAVAPHPGRDRLWRHIAVQEHAAADRGADQSVDAGRRLLRADGRRVLGRRTSGDGGGLPGAQSLAAVHQGNGEKGAARRQVRRGGVCPGANAERAAQGVRPAGAAKAGALR